MKQIAIEEDLSVLENRAGNWFYRDYQIQADPNVHRFIVNYLSETRHVTSILDLGSGYGALPAQLLDSGHKVESTSWNGKCNVGDRIHEINLDSGFSLDNRFSVLTAVDVIEHVENPWAFMRSCSDHMEENGILFVSTPNIECAWARIQWLVKGHPSAFSPEEIKFNRHISQIWRQGFYAMAAQAGLQVFKTYPFGSYSQVSKLKRTFFLAFEKLLPDYAAGYTTLYVLTKTKVKMSIGADEIY